MLLTEEGLAEEGLAEEGLAEEGLAEEDLAEEGLAEEGLAEEDLAEEGLAKEGDTRNSLVPKQLGADPAGGSADRSGEPDVGRRERLRPAFIIGGIAIMSLLAASIALMLSSNHPATEQPSAAHMEADTVSAAEAIVRAETESAARDWLTLVDAEDWEASWSEAGATFRAPNTLKGWTEISNNVRPPFGEVLSRQTGNHLDIPAPPKGFRVIQFRTAFANKPVAIETVSLEREDGEWKVVGYYIA